MYVDHGVLGAGFAPEVPLTGAHHRRELRPAPRALPGAREHLRLRPWRRRRFRRRRRWLPSHPRRSYRPAAPAARHAELIGFPDELAVAALAVDDHGCLPLTPRGPLLIGGGAAAPGRRGRHLRVARPVLAPPGLRRGADAAAALGWW